jgi:hypothetical protein
MAKKTIGRSYFLFGSDNIYKRGNYYFSGYCPHCTKHVYLNDADSVKFIENARPWVDRRPWWVRLWKKVPKVRLVVEQGSEIEMREKMAD